MTQDEKGLELERTDTTTLLLGAIYGHGKNLEEWRPQARKKTAKLL